MKDQVGFIGEYTFQLEVIGVEKDMLRCSYQNAAGAHCQKVYQCDGGEYGNTDIHGETMVTYFLSTNDPLCACRETYDAECANDTVIYVAKPLTLRQSPWDGKIIKYNPAKADEFEISYVYASPEKRTALYLSESARCTPGSHVEIIWPAYRARVGKFGDDGYIPGDLIWIATNTIDTRNDLIDITPDPAFLPADDCNLHEPLAPGTEALNNIDMNYDGRRWADDCGKGGGGGGGSVWV